MANCGKTGFCEGYSAWSLEGVMGVENYKILLDLPSPDPALGFDRYAEALDNAEQEAKRPRSFYHAGFNALNEAFKEFRKNDPARRIVVFVDDLDRCLPESALQVLESMKLFFDFEGFVFVVGLDQAVVEWLINARFRKEYPPAAGEDTTNLGMTNRGGDYLNKIFQVPFTLR